MINQLEYFKIYCIFLFIPLLTFGQWPVEQLSSQNGLFKVGVNGHYDEGFAGFFQITLKDSLNDTLWSKSFDINRSADFPTVSNKGDVALIIDNSILLYDSYGNLKGSYKDTLWYSSDNFLNQIHSFSTDGSVHYTFTRRWLPYPKYKTFLIATDDSANLKWKTDLGEFYPVTIQFYKNLVILSDSYRTAVNYSNKIFAVKDNGEIKFDFEIGTAISVIPIILEDSNEMWVYVKNKIVSINLPSGEIKGFVNKSDLFELLYSDNPNKVRFALMTLQRAERTEIHYSKKIKDQLRHLMYVDNNPDDWRSYGITNLSRSLLKKLR